MPNQEPNAIEGKAGQIKKTPESFEERIGEKALEELYAEKKEALEKRELLLEKEKLVREKLKEEVMKIRLSFKLKEEAKLKAKQIKNLDTKERLRYLLVLAEKQGVAFAVKIARNMKDAYALDLFHDILARDNLYKKFPK